MNADYQISEPILFNPIKHHLGFIKEFMNRNIDNNNTDILALKKDIRNIGRSVMDVYTGRMPIKTICNEVGDFLRMKNITESESFAKWAGVGVECFRIIRLSDNSQWTLKFHDNQLRYVHIFPARSSQFTFRVKSNTLKSALVYNIVIGKDLVTGDDLNKVRPILGLSPVKDAIDTEAIVEMIEILRG
jgi:hypothetical protein